MKIIYVVCLLVALFGICSAIPAKNIEEFVLGFADGVEIELNANVTQCVQDSDVTFDDFETSFADLDEGFKKKNLTLITKGIEELGSGIAEVSVVLSACDVGTIAADIANIAKELMSGPSGILDVILKEAINIFHNGKDLTTDFKDAISSWKDKDYFDSGKYVGEITGVLLED